MSRGCPAILLDTLCVRSFEPGDAVAADRRPAAVMLIVGGDVADRGVQANGVVLGPDAGELGVERGGVGDAGQVRPVALQMGEEALDVRLVACRRLRLMGAVGSGLFV